ncbi:MAG: hypothetical protein LQ342_004167 [Letrouitia transgressa]|nr:MAG: hypothetical protein LQ342_004167 [Letrouitia transgressa]
MAPGGKGSNTAVAVHRLTRSNPKKKQPSADGPALADLTCDDDINVRMVGTVGSLDDFGKPLKKNLVKCGINVDGVRVVEGERSAVTNILVNAGTKAKRIMQFPGAAYSVQAEDFMTAESLGGGVRPDLLICQLECHRSAVEQAIETAGREGIDVLLNPSPAFFLGAEYYPHITHLVMNETEAVLLSKMEVDDVEQQSWSKVATYFIAELGVKNVVVTLGEKGASYHNGITSGFVKAETNLTVRDTSGAG